MSRTTKKTSKSTVTKVTTKEAAVIKFTKLGKARPAAHLAEAAKQLGTLKNELASAQSAGEVDLTTAIKQVEAVITKVNGWTKTMPKKIEAAKKRKIREMTKDEREAKKVARAEAKKSKLSEQLVKSVKALKETGLTKAQIEKLLAS